MPLSLICKNCGQPKQMENYGDTYCPACTTAIKEAREYALRENLDPGQLQRAVLAERAHHTHRNRIDPRDPMSKNKYWQNENSGS